MYSINNYGSETPYGPGTIELPDDMFESDAKAAAFAEGFQGLIETHSVFTDQDYRMSKTTQSTSEIWPSSE